jgi:single-strand DNA-binding protein
MNNVTLLGRLGKDPENKNGAVKFSIATNDGSKDKLKTNWHNIVAFGKTGESIEKFFKKGDMIGIVGRLDYNQHEGKTYTSIIANSFAFTGKSEASAPLAGEEVNQSSDDDDMPF